MPSRTKTNAANRAAWVFVILGAVTLGAVATVAQMGRTVPNALRKTSAPAPVIQQEVPKTVVETPKAETVKVFRPSFGEQFTTESHVSEVPRGVDPHVFAVNDYISQIKAVPQEARVKSVVVKDGVAEIDFTAALRHGYGTEDEQMLVEGVCRVMGQFKDVTHVRFLLEGQPVDTLGGADLRQPLAVTR
ncbi:MAG: GerMN domain-containing protein [Armatimonadetes bacterium]|nr:GerMN domain-containing protein [Armatimonadota bacterium]